MQADWGDLLIYSDHFIEYSSIPRCARLHSKHSPSIRHIRNIRNIKMRMKKKVTNYQENSRRRKNVRKCGTNVYDKISARSKNRNTTFDSSDPPVRYFPHKFPYHKGSFRTVPVTKATPKNLTQGLPATRLHRHKASPQDTRLFAKRSPATQASPQGTPLVSLHQNLPVGAQTTHKFHVPIYEHMSREQRAISANRSSRSGTDSNLPNISISPCPAINTIHINHQRLICVHGASRRSETVGMISECRLLRK